MQDSKRGVTSYSVLLAKNKKGSTEDSQAQHEQRAGKKVRKCV